ncbi:uncharacterized protein MELLADRAFT_87866 [Melampsora larici-populina 98AG31]|uniref:Uncharacterized protein n=1 Tax=Melampsora larici-populina (strain 98AG31 / pathotype 3-4-7) TaxID=747676 RepID=F4RPT3_MELLP|nr:uncharacterized protein MELLADRAFT_87866 [Melampsora larici-populina 98AG31]EGG05684.1 hypothetical protein MELLADRAFT_87866 [Melampsora larici-populina 98AG31]
MSHSFSHDSPFPSVPDFITSQEEQPRYVREEPLGATAFSGMDEYKEGYDYSQPCSRRRNAKSVRLCVTASGKSRKCDRGRVANTIKPPPERPVAQNIRRAGMEMASLFQIDPQEHGAARAEGPLETGQGNTHVAARIKKWQSIVKHAGVDWGLTNESHGTREVPRKRGREDEFLSEEGNLRSPVKKIVIRTQASAGEQWKDQSRGKLFLEENAAQLTGEEANWNLEEGKSSDATSDIWGEVIPSPFDGKFIIEKLKTQANDMEKFIAKKTKDIAGLIPKGDNFTGFLGIWNDMRDKFKAYKGEVKLIVKPLEGQ